jgi:hypothetical protein
MMQRLTRHSRWAAVLAMAATLTALLCARSVRADAKEAAIHVAAGRAAAQRGDWGAALTEFQAAYGAKESVETLRWIADAQFHTGKDVEALESYEQVARSLARLDPPTRNEIRRHVEDRLIILQARIGTLTITVAEAGATVFLDDRQVGFSPLGLTKRVTQGTHRVRAERGGAKVDRDVEVAAGKTSAVELRLPAEVGAQDAGAPPPVTADAGAAPKPAGPADEGPWQVPHGSVHYKAIRASVPPRIDGVLDDEVWRRAPADDHFLSTTSTPYGKPTTEPTTVQLAYDSQYLYVAFTCRYGKPGARDDSYAVDEPTTAAAAEAVAIMIDPLHDHANALGFIVSRSGGRADVELTDNGAIPNIGWSAIWDVETQRSADVWTAEYRIPWGSLRIPAHDERFTMGVNFRRRVPSAGELSLWALEPPAAPGLYDTTYFGHLEGLEHVAPDLRLYVQPYVAVAFDQRAGTLPSGLDDFTGTRGNFRTYAGGYVRYYPPGPLRFEATANPDFAAVVPDQAVANFNRFELLYPENRPFFQEDNPRFVFGDQYSYQPAIDPVSQLFYSRRVGIVTNPLTGATSSVPILYGAKAILRTPETEVGAMNVGLSTQNPKISLADNVGVIRLNENFAEGRHVGGILLGRTGSVSNYVAGGIDGKLTLYDRHLIVSGFTAASRSTAPTSGMGQLGVDWNSRDFYAATTYTEIGGSFDAQLGYVPLVGVRSNVVQAGYTPFINADLLQQIFLEAGINDTRRLNEELVFAHGNADANLVLTNGATIKVSALPAVENVTAQFPLFAGRVNVLPGHYDVMVYQTDVSTAPRRPVVASLGYQAGDLFGGRQRSPYGGLELNLGHFTSNAMYHLFVIQYEGQLFVGHQVDTVLSYSYTPLARTTLIVNANTLIDRAVAQFVTSYRFGLLSTVALVIAKSTGVTPVPASQWLTAQAPFSAVLSFAFGLSPF